MNKMRFFLNLKQLWTNISDPSLTPASLNFRAPINVLLCPITMLDEENNPRIITIMAAVIFLVSLVLEQNS